MMITAAAAEHVGHEQRLSLLTHELRRRLVVLPVAVRELRRLVVLPVLRASCDGLLCCLLLRASCGGLLCCLLLCAGCGGALTFWWPKPAQRSPAM